MVGWGGEVHVTLSGRNLQAAFSAQASLMSSYPPPLPPPYENGGEPKLSAKVPPCDTASEKSEFCAKSKS